MSDLMTRTLQVRLNYPKSDVHKIVRQTFNKADGYVYTTKCGDFLRASKGAMRTTREVDCDGCLPPRWTP